MDILILIAFLIVGLAMVLGKPFRFEITHKYEQPTVVQPTGLGADDQKKLDNQELPVSMDGVINALNDMMGVNKE